MRWLKRKQVQWHTMLTNTLTMIIMNILSLSFEFYESTVPFYKWHQFSLVIIGIICNKRFSCSNWILTAGNITSKINRIFKNGISFYVGSTLQILQFVVNILLFISYWCIWPENSKTNCHFKGTKHANRLQSTYLMILIFFSLFWCSQRHDKVVNEKKMKYVKCET